MDDRIQNKPNPKTQWVNYLMQMHSEYTHNLKLSPVTINITNNKKIIGKWYNETKTIDISEELLKRYPLYTVEGVFKHEIAHQIVDEIYHGDKQSHGFLFKKACEQIRVPKPFRYTTLHTIEDVPSFLRRPYLIEDDKVKNPKQKIINKVRKLLALATSSNKYESELAMTKANKLIVKHNIYLQQNVSDKKFVTAVINLKRKRLELYHRYLSRLLRDFFFVYVISSNVYDFKYTQHDAKDNLLFNDELQKFRSYELSGTPHNVEIALYAWDFIMNKMEKLYAEYRKETGKSGYVVGKSFYTGLIEGFRSKLEKQDEVIKEEFGFKENYNTVCNIIISEDIELKEYYKKRYPNLRYTSSKSRSHDSHSYEFGHKQGSKLTLNKGIHNKSKSIRQLT